MYTRIWKNLKHMKVAISYSLPAAPVNVIKGEEKVRKNRSTIMKYQRHRELYKG